ncbi:MAG TPA: exodeoxyribonuclease VII small subunit [Phycisphaerae bacterium]|nr:exodeoxyribonuclease VII small subunit [Phycisphaerae bacterium]
MSKTPKKLKFEEAMERLDAIVAAMESGEIGVEDSIAKYEEAMTLAAHCRQILDQAEQRIQKIQLDAAGKPQVSPFEPPAASGTDEAGDDEEDL